MTGALTVADGLRRAANPLLLTSGAHGLSATVDRARMAEEAGAEYLWLSQPPDGHDSAVIAAACAAATRSMHIGTGVIPAAGHHPVHIAQTVSALADLSGGRFALGLGAGHPFVNEFVLGLAPVPPVAAMREYLTIVRTLLGEGRVDFAGRHHTAHASNLTGHGAGVPILLGGMRRRMIELAAELADGLLLWLVPLRYVEEHVLPAVHDACARIGRDPATLPVLVEVPVYLAGDHPNLERDLEGLVIQYAMMPAYRHVFETSGFGDRLATGDIDRAMTGAIAITGDAGEIAGRLEEFRTLGCVPVPTAAIGDGPLALDTPAAFERYLKAVCVA
ncbi:LLM class flavin-dependent oxidoreductase [Actinomadura opuntiae]|uniref:LLM class flavin-dependent oxidoreductase n=1 Tax=Actinomadura sp. OS1-43 TaxID=604315 RepID=UPI00255AD45F|nr:LLM class flavin-dependent oxidoreductase [Actinomadura sp. OS1-43]MDL4817191.1 LLM class flavin-dependent oxidoreductase [Actinomadura sp. OS1-43]